MGQVISGISVKIDDEGRWNPPLICRIYRTRNLNAMQTIMFSHFLLYENAATKLSFEGSQVLEALFWQQLFRNPGVVRDDIALKGILFIHISFTLFSV